MRLYTAVLKAEAVSEDVAAAEPAGAAKVTKPRRRSKVEEATTEGRAVQVDPRLTPG